MFRERVSITPETVIHSVHASLEKKYPGRFAPETVAATVNVLFDNARIHDFIPILAERKLVENGTSRHLPQPTSETP